MKNKSMSKKLVDRLVYGGLFALYAISIYMYVYKLIYKQPTLHTFKIVVISILVTVAVVTVGIIVVIKKYGPYRDEGEKQPPFIAYFTLAMLGQYLTRAILDKADTIAETSTDVTVGAIKIIALLTLLLVAIISTARAVENWTAKQNSKQKDNGRN